MKLFQSQECLTFTLPDTGKVQEGTNCPDGSFGGHQLLDGPSSSCMSEPLWAYTACPVQAQSK